MYTSKGVLGYSDGYISSYEFSMEGLRVLDLNGEPILSWLYVLLDNRVFSTDTPLASEAKRYIQREFGLDYEKYDVITGYRADDSYFSYAQDFINNGITVDQLKTAMHLGDLGDQIVLKSRKAFKQIEFLGAEKVLRDPWLNRKKDRGDKARKAYFSTDRMSYVPGGIYVNRIIEEEIKRDDPRLR